MSWTHTVFAFTDCFHMIAYMRERLQNVCTKFAFEGFANADEFASMHRHA